ncbi:hypothetical protein KKB55_22625 [Myxococcota bacterium]|nr:hypothetical protein [Myxococcota bacterium]MBU1900550.1 hypothetical protein [Myxococcota bacterium]
MPSLQRFNTDKSDQRPCSPRGLAAPRWILMTLCGLSLTLGCRGEDDDIAGVDDAQYSSDTTLDDTVLSDTALSDAVLSDAALEDADGQGALPLGDCDENQPCEPSFTTRACARVEEGLYVCAEAPPHLDLPAGCTIEGAMGGPFSPNCCAPADCVERPAGHCVHISQCGGAGCHDEVYCVYDECQSTADCAADHLCLQAGARGLLANTCVSRVCQRDADCRAGEAGECRLLGWGYGVVLACVYADSACREDQACRDECSEGYCGLSWSAGPNPQPTGAPICRDEMACMMP